jgi:fatty acid desaturase
MSKSKSNSTRDSIAIWIVSAFVGLLAFAFTQSIFMLFFAPIVIGLLWNLANRVKRLEARLSQGESSQGQEPKATEAQ